MSILISIQIMERVNTVLAKSIRLAEALDTVVILHNKKFRSKSRQLSELLRRLSSSLDLYPLCCYGEPVRQIVDYAETVIDELLPPLEPTFCTPNIVAKIINCFFYIIPASGMKQLEKAIDCVTCLLQVGDNAQVNAKLVCTALFMQKMFIMPIFGLVWELIAIIRDPCGSEGVLSDAAAALCQTAGDSDDYAMVIAEEGGVEPLLRLMQDGPMEIREMAARTIGFLGRARLSCACENRKENGFARRREVPVKGCACATTWVDKNACKVFAKMLREGHKKVQALVALAVSNIAAKHPECQDLFANQGIVRLLVDHLAFEALRVINANADVNANDEEDPATKVEMKAMATRALGNLAKDNPSICRSLAESSAILCFALLLEKGSEDVQLHCARALKEITAVAEKDAEFRTCAFSPKSPTYKFVVDQLIIKIADQRTDNWDLLESCIQAVGNLAMTFGATATRAIAALVQVLDSREHWVLTWAATIALKKFVRTENCFHLDHSKGILSAGGAKQLIGLIDSAHEIDTLILISCIILDAPEEELLALVKVLSPFKYFPQKPHNIMIRGETPHTLLQKAKSRLVGLSSVKSNGFPNPWKE